MFVTNHVLSGVIIGRLLKRRPVTAFVVGVGSHLALDMVPHWGCDMRSAEGRQLFLRIAKRDGLLGLLVMACAAGAVDRGSRKATIAAMTGAALLDADKPMVFYFRRNPFPRVVRQIHARSPERIGSRACQTKSSSGCRVPSQTLCSWRVPGAAALLCPSRRHTGPLGARGLFCEAARMRRLPGAATSRWGGAVAIPSTGGSPSPARCSLRRRRLAHPHS